jgi:hypothetical protein
VPTLILTGAELFRVNLSGAILSEANLSGARSAGATIKARSRCAYQRPSQRPSAGF